MVISPSSGPVGTTYTFSLSEFAPGETVTIELFLQETFELIASGTATVDAAGSGRFQFTSQPVHPAGDYTARATGGTSLAELFGDFRIDE